MLPTLVILVGKVSGIPKFANDTLTGYDDVGGRKPRSPFAFERDFERVVGHRSYLDLLKSVQTLFIEADVFIHLITLLHEHRYADKTTHLVVCKEVFVTFNLLMRDSNYAKKCFWALMKQVYYRISSPWIAPQLFSVLLRFASPLFFPKVFLPYIFFSFSFSSLSLVLYLT